MLPGLIGSSYFGDGSQTDFAGAAEG